MENDTTSGMQCRLTLSNSGCKVNEISARELLNYYYQAGFIYEAKSARIEPYLPEILKNWDKAIGQGLEIAKVVTYSPQPQYMASTMMWRYTDTTWVGQHLVSTGTRISHIPMLAIHGSMIEDQTMARIKHICCWYNPDNKIPRLFFEGSVKFLGSNAASLTRWNYFGGMDSGHYYSSVFKVTEGNQSNYPVFKNFMDQVMDPIWYESQEFNIEDLEMNELNSLYKKAGLERTRKLLLAFKNKEELPAAVAICYRGPIGLSLSFLENKVQVIFKDGHPEADQLDLIKSMLSKAGPYYEDLGLNYIPVLIQQEGVRVMEQGLHLPLLNRYNQSVWSRSAFQDWYDFIKMTTDKYGATQPAVHTLSSQEV